MTTIVGIQGDGYAVVASDTRITGVVDNGSITHMMTLGPGCAKIATNGKYILGAAGDLRAINILHYAFQPPTPTPGLRGKKLDAFIVNKFIPALRACFDSAGYSPPDTKDSKEHVAEQGSSIFVVVNATIYIIDVDYSWASDVTGVYACGSGADFAMGALHVLINGKKLSLSQAKAVALKALSVAAKFDPSTGAPFTTMTQEAEKK